MTVYRAAYDRRKTQPPPAKDWPDNDEELVALGAKRLPANYWSLADAFEGLQVFGGTGSGKSSGSGQTIARAFGDSSVGSKHSQTNRGISEPRQPNTA